MFLARFIETRSADLEEVRESTLSNAGATHFDAKPLDHPFEFQANAARSEHGSLIFVRANANIFLNFRPVSYLRLVFQTAGRSRIELPRQSMSSIPTDAGYLIPAGVEWKSRHPEGYSNLSLRAELGALTSKLSTWIGKSCEAPLEFMQPGGSSLAHRQTLRQYVFLAARELDTAAEQLIPECLKEIQAGLQIRILLYIRHNYSHMLWIPPRSPGKRKLTRVEELLRPAHGHRSFGVGGGRKRAKRLPLLLRRIRADSGRISQDLEARACENAADAG
jgi:hypothetical protein